MTKVHYKSSAMMNYAIVSLKDGAKKLQNAVNTSGTLVIPNDFSERNYLKRLPEELKSNLNELSKLISWIESNDLLYNKITEELSKSIDSISEVIISKRIAHISRK